MAFKIRIVLKLFSIPDMLDKFCLYDLREYQ